MHLNKEVKMKTSIILTLLLVFFYSTVHAVERETLLAPQKYESGGFGGPTISFTQLNDKSTWGLGGKGAWLVNHAYYIGGGGYNTFLNESNNDGILQHEGLILGFVGRPNRIFHYSVELLIGGGQLIIDQQDDFDAVFAAEPQAYLSINLATFAVLNVGVSYRYISGSNNNTYSSSDLSGAAFNINVMFGKH